MVQAAGFRLERLEYGWRNKRTVQERGGIRERAPCLGSLPESVWRPGLPKQRVRPHPLCCPARGQETAADTGLSLIRTGNRPAREENGR